MQPGKPGPYPGVAPGPSGNPGLPGSGGSGEGGQGGAYPAYLQQQNQLLARHLQQPMGLPLNRLTPQQTQQVRHQGLNMCRICIATTVPHLLVSVQGCLAWIFVQSNHGLH